MHLAVESCVRAVRLHPVELALAVAGCVGCLWAYEADSEKPLLLARLCLVPLFFALAFAIDKLARGGVWRNFYWVCWLPAIPLALWGGLSEWTLTASYRVTLGILAPLVVLMCRRAVENRQFVGDGMVYVRSAALSALFANVVLGLFCAILYSTAYIFGIEGPWTSHTAICALILCETLAVPVLFLVMHDRWQGLEIRGGRIVEVLLHYIATPAVLIYLGILYLYIAKIVALWSLPEGGVAYMVFGFTIFALVVKAVREILESRLFEWFFSRFSLFALPPLVLFWVGVARRIGEYGLTESRVYLVVCGALMTVALLLFLSRRAGRYLYVCMVAFIVFAAVAYVPALDPYRLAVHSQAARAEGAVERLQLLNSDGRLALHTLVTADSTQRMDYRTLYDALQYLERYDSTAFGRFGLADMEAFRQTLPVDLYSYVVSGYDLSDEGYNGERQMVAVSATRTRTTPVAGYTKLYTNLAKWGGETPNYGLSGDTLRIDFGAIRPPFTITGRELIIRQLHAIGADENAIPDQRALQACADEFLTYSDGELLILFSRLEIERRDSLPALRFADIEALLVR